MHRMGLRAFALSAGLSLAVWGGAQASAATVQAQDPATSTAPAAVAWRRVKTLMEAGPMLVGDATPLNIRLTGEPCISRLVVTDSSGPRGSGSFVRWRELGRPTVEPVEGGHVVLHADAGVWFGFPPFELARTEAAAAAIGDLVAQCAEQPLAEVAPSFDRYVDLEGALATVIAELEQIQAIDAVSRDFTYKVERTSSLCHINVMKMEPGTVSGWLDDNYITMVTESRISTVDGSVGVWVLNPHNDTDFLQTDTRARAQTLQSQLLDWHRLCAQFQPS